MAKLSKYEKETIIHFNERDKDATIYTFNPGLKRQLAEFSSKYPALCFLKRRANDGSVTYTVEKSRLLIRLIPPYSDEQRAAVKELAEKHGFQVIHSLKKAS